MLVLVAAGCAADGIQFQAVDLSVPDLAVAPPDLTSLDDLSPTGDLSTCPPGTRPCGVSCIPEAFCCRDADCPAAGQRCLVNGTCQCPLDSKPCGKECIPLAACCDAADCRGTPCVRGLCAAPGCVDGITNANETDIDCGGGFCGPCPATRACALALDCRSWSCRANQCVESMDRYDYGGGVSPRFIRSADLDGDGKADLVTLNAFSHNLSVLLGRGDGTFRSAGSVATGTNPVNAELVDVNGDGKVDVVSANSGSLDLSVLLGNGDGTLQRQRRVHVGSTPLWVSAGDIDQDGRLDLAVANNVVGSIGLLGGNGDGTFGPQREVFPVVSRPRSVLLRDLDGDARLDLVTQCTGSPPPWVVGLSTGALTVFRGLPGGQFAPSAALPTPTTLLTSLAAGDLDGDGRPDFVLGAPSLVAPTAFLTTAMGALRYAGILSSSVYAPFAQIADMNGDRNADYVSSSAIFLGNGNGSFAAARHYNGNGVTSGGVAVADFDRDGKLDVAWPNNGDNSVVVQLGNGDGTTAPPPPQGSKAFDIGLVNPRLVQLADLDGDLRADVIVAGGTSSLSVRPALLVYRAGKGGLLEAPTTQPLGQNAIPTGLAIADINGDKKLDTVVVSSSESQLYLLPGLGNGAMGVPMTINLPQPFRLVAAGDLDKDGATDLALTSAGTELAVYFGRGDGTFRAGPTFQVGKLPAHVQIVDWNGDGWRDLVTVNHDTSDVSLVLGKGPDGNGALQFAAVFQAPLPGAPAVAAAAFADLDGDKRLDLLVADGSGGAGPANGVRTYVDRAGQGAPPVFMALGTHRTFSPPYAAALGDLDLDGNPDFVTAAGSERSVSFLYGSGGGAFRPTINQDVGTGPASVAIGDVDGNGRPDVVTANPGGNTITVLLQ